MPINSFLYPAPSTPSFAYNVANSVRTNKADQPKGVVTQGTPTNVDKYTFSVWIKRADIGASNSKIFSVSSGSTYGEEKLEFNQDDLIWRHTQASDGSTVWERVTDRKFRDPSAWYHIVVAYDSSQGTAANRCKMYINGVEETSFSGSSNPSSGLDSYTNTSGRAFKFFTFHEDSNTSQDASAYFAEMVYIDGQQLDQTSFGEFDSDSPNIWKPIDVSGLTFGNNGFYLDFEDSSDLGADVSGNNNDLTFSNIAATDQSTDTCTNNAITMNPLDDVASSTYSEGNLKVVTSASGSAPHFTTFGLTTGKWYWEVKATSFTEHADGYITIGITGNQGNSTTNQLGHLANDYAFVNNGQIQANTGNDTDYGSTYTQGQIIGTYLDLDNNKLYFSINGTLQNSGTGHSITAASSTTPGFYMPSFSDYSSSSSNLVTVEWNFGAGTTFAISSGNSDDNGYGNFEYSPNITGDGAAKKFYTINSKNLAEFG
tara:strand:- start:1030 stop:2484 length:1455 start_codon:yes stop_codon:yes gene_type:complete